ncbi:MAG: hypothetical protein JWR83_3208 [Aeromicrobium sp.]|nr:hypothetical protein [Aeromicrobium sp.]
MRRGIAVSAVLMVCVLGACGGKDNSAASSDGSTPSATSSKPDATKAMDVCKTISTDDIGAIMGATVTAEEVPGGGCTYNQTDLHAPSIGIFAIIGAGGGYDATKGGVAVKGTPEDLSGIGDGAWVAVGTMGGDNLQGQGVASVGNQLINISLNQSKGLSGDVVKDFMTKLLTLAAGKA